MRCYLCHEENGKHLDGCPKFGTATPQPATVIAAATFTGTGTFAAGGGGRGYVTITKRYFRMHDGGATYTVVARTLPHAEHILRTSGAEFSAEGWPYDRAKEAGHLHWSEFEAQYATTLKVDIDGKMVPLVDCNFGDWFCSEY